MKTSIFDYASTYLDNLIKWSFNNPSFTKQYFTKQD